MMKSTIKTKTGQTFVFGKLSISWFLQYQGGNKIRWLQFRRGAWVKSVQLWKANKAPGKRIRGRNFAETRFLECGCGWSQTYRGLRVVLMGRERMRVKIWAE